MDTASSESTKMSSRWFGYTLSDPRDGAVRYVGTTQDCKKRLRIHIHDGRRVGPMPVNKWVSELLAAGHRPTMTIVETIDGPWQEGHANTVEARWIAHHLALGAALLNRDNVARATAAHGLALELWASARALMRVIDARHLTMSEAAEQIGVASRPLYAWASGEHPPNWRSRVLMAAWSNGEVPIDGWPALPEPKRPRPRVEFVARRPRSPRPQSSSPVTAPRVVEPRVSVVDQVIAILRGASSPMGNGALAAAVRADQRAVNVALFRLKRRGLAVSVQPGMWAATGSAAARPIAATPGCACATCDALRGAS